MFTTLPCLLQKHPKTRPWMAWESLRIFLNYTWFLFPAILWPNIATSEGGACRTTSQTLPSRATQQQISPSVTPSCYILLPMVTPKFNSVSSCSYHLFSSRSPFNVPFCTTPFLEGVQLVQLGMAPDTCGQNESFGNKHRPFFSQFRHTSAMGPQRNCAQQNLSQSWSEATGPGSVETARKAEYQIEGTAMRLLNGPGNLCHVDFRGLQTLSLDPRGFRFDEVPFRFGRSAMICLHEKDWSPICEANATRLARSVADAEEESGWQSCLMILMLHEPHGFNASGLSGPGTKWVKSIRIQPIWIHTAQGFTGSYRINIKHHQKGAVDEHLPWHWHITHRESSLIAEELEYLQDQFLETQHDHTEAEKEFGGGDGASTFQTF